MNFFALLSFLVGAGCGVAATSHFCYRAVRRARLDAEAMLQLAREQQRELIRARDLLIQLQAAIQKRRQIERDDSFPGDEWKHGG
jgi:hypothetical protein